MTVDINEGKKAEEQSGFLAQLQATLNVIPAHTWYASPSGGLTFVNKRTADYLGLPKDHPLRFGTDVGAQWDAHLPFVHPDDRAETQENWSSRLRTGEGGEGSFRVRNAQGHYRWFLSRAEPIRASDGTIMRWVGVNLDIEERKCAEQALEESEHKLRQIIETVPSHLWSADPNFEPTHLNKRLLDYFGKSFEDFQHGGWETFLHPDDLSETATAISHAIQTGSYFQVVHRLRRTDGQFRWHHARGEPLRDGQGNIVQWYGLSVDIDEAKKAEERLRRSEAHLAESEYKLRRIVETVPGLVWSLAPDGEPTHFNQRFLDYFGRPFEDFKHGGWLALIHPDDVSETERTFSHAIRTGTSYRGVLRFRRADGEYRWHEGRGEPLRDGQGNIVQWYGLSVDIDEAKKAEERLRRSEAHLAVAQRLSHSGVSAYNETTILYGSEETYRIWGFDPTQGVPSLEAMRQRIHPDDLERHLAQVRRALDEKTGYSISYRIVLPDGTLKHLDSIGQPVFSASGELTEVIATQIDVTERKRAEEALRESEYKLRQIVETVPSLVWSLAPDGEPTYVSRRILDFIGAQLEDYRHRGWQAFLHPDDLPETEKAFYQAIQTGTSYEAMHRLRRSDGKYRWHQARGEPLRDERGRIVQWYGLTIDIHERKMAEDRLRRSEAHLAEAQRLSHSGASVYNATRILYWSDETYRIWGFNPRDGLPSREAVLQRIHPDDLGRVLAEATRALDEKRGYSIGYRIVLPDGTAKHLDSLSQPVFSASGELVEVMSTQIDVTERKRAEEAYREAQLELAHANRVAAMGQLTSSIAHEVNQPIAAAVTYALAARRFLRAEPPNFQEVDEALSLIVKEGNRAGEVVERVRALIKKERARKDTVEINDVILEVIALTRTEATNNSVSVRTQLAEGFPRLQGDRVQLQQVLLNLIINAIEAMRDVGEAERELLISSRNEPDSVSVEVRDSGPGLTPEALDRVFEAFYTTKPGGLGLGLSICRSIMEAHNGRLWANNNVPRGAIFSFTAPAHPVAAS